MAAQMKPTTKKTSVKNNIAKFRQDRRLLVVGLFQGLGLLLMLAVLVYSIVAYQDYLSPASLRQGLRYLGATASQGNTALLDISPDEDAAYLPMGMGMISASRDGFRYHSMVESNRFHTGGNFRGSALTAGNRLALIYDRGGNTLTVSTSYGQVWSKTLDSTILSASMNPKGAFALVTNETGYRCAVSVYNNAQKLLCKWLSSQYYILSASVNHSTDAFAALCFSSDGSQVKTQVIFFRVGEESAFASMDLQNRSVCSMKYDNSGNLFILCEDGLLVADSNGNTVLDQRFSGTLTGYYHREGLAPLLVFTGAADDGEVVRLLMLDAAGNALCDRSFSGTYVDAATDGEVVHLLLSDKLISFFADGTQETNVSCSGASTVLAGSNHSPILLYSDRAEKLQLH